MLSRCNDGVLSKPIPADLILHCSSPQIFSSYMILRATCEEVLRKIKAEVASDTPEVQAGAGKPEPTGAASVHVTAVPAAADGAGPMQCRHYLLRTCWVISYRFRTAWRHDHTAWPDLNCFAQRGLLREYDAFTQMQQAELVAMPVFKQVLRRCKR